MHHSIIFVFMQWLRSGTDYAVEKQGEHFVSRYGRRMRAFSLLLCIGFFWLSFIFVHDSLRSTTARAHVILTLLALPFVAGGVWCVATAFYYRVTFTAGAATVRRPFHAEETVRFGQVMGMRRKKHEYRVETERGWVRLADEYANGWRLVVERCEIQIAGENAGPTTQE